MQINHIYTLNCFPFDRKKNTSISMVHEKIDSKIHGYKNSRNQLSLSIKCILIYLRVLLTEMLSGCNPVESAVYIYIGIRFGCPS